MKNKHFGMSDSSWENFKKNMRERTAQAVGSGEYSYARKVKQNPFVVVQPADPNSCPSFCPECKGMNYKVDPRTGEVSECSHYRERLSRAGVPDPSSDQYLESIE